MNNRIHKYDIVKRVSEKLKGKKIPMPTIGIQKVYTLTIIEIVIDAFLEVLLEIIEEGNVVALTGYMTIEHKLQEEKIVCCYGTGEKTVVPAHYRTKVLFGRKFQEACKKLTERELK